MDKIRGSAPYSERPGINLKFSRQITSKLFNEKNRPSPANSRMWSAFIVV